MQKCLDENRWEREDLGVMVDEAISGRLGDLVVLGVGEDVARKEVLERAKGLEMFRERYVLPFPDVSYLDRYVWSAITDIAIGQVDSFRYAWWLWKGRGSAVHYEGSGHRRRHLVASLWPQRETGRDGSIYRRREQASIVIIVVEQRIFSPFSSGAQDRAIDYGHGTSSADDAVYLAAFREVSGRRILRLAVLHGK